MIFLSFEVFGNMIKHYLECLIRILIKKQIPHIEIRVQSVSYC